MSLLITLALAAPRTWTYDVREGASSGTVTVRVEERKDEVRIRQQFKLSNQPERTTTWTYGLDGTLKRAETSAPSTIIDGRRVRKGTVRMSFTFSAEGVGTGEIHTGLRKIPQSVAAPVVPSLDPTLKWFDKDPPAPGTRVQFCRFDILNLTWNVVNATYVGSATVAVGGKTVNGHEIAETVDQKPGRRWVDERGDLLKWETEQRVWVRR